MRIVIPCRSATRASASVSRWGVQVRVALGYDRSHHGGVDSRLDVQHILTVGPVGGSTYLQLMPRHVGPGGFGFIIR